METQANNKKWLRLISEFQATIRNVSVEGQMELFSDADFEGVILDKLSDTLDIEQKKNKVRNNLQALRKDGVIENIGNTWVMSKGVTG